MKYAIAQTSGKQFLIKPGQWYDVDFINGNLGDFIYLNKILKKKFNETKGLDFELISKLNEKFNLFIKDSLI